MDDAPVSQPGWRQSDSVLRVAFRNRDRLTVAADALAGAARAMAALSGRDFAIPDDVKTLFVPAMRHRIVLGPGAEIEGRDADQVLENILNQIEAPR